MPENYEHIDNFNNIIEGWKTRIKQRGINFGSQPNQMQTITPNSQFSTPNQTPSMPQINTGDNQAMPQMQSPTMGTTPQSMPQTSPNDLIQQQLLSKITGQNQGGTFDKFMTNLNSPANQALLHMGLGILSTPPRNIPYSDMEVLGRGGLAGLQGMEKATANQDAETNKLLTMLQTSQKETDLKNYRTSDLSIKQQKADALRGKQGKSAEMAIPDTLADQLGLPHGTTYEQANKIKAGFETGKDTPSPLKVMIGALKDDLGREPTSKEIDAELEKREGKKNVNKITVAVAGAEARGRAFANEKLYSMYDKEIGAAIKVKGNVLNNDTGNRYLDLQDPTVKSDTQSLVKITKGMDSISAFEKGASQSLDFAQSVAKDFGLGKYPKANTVSQLFQYHTGDTKVKGLKNALTTAATEYMKVTNAGSDLTAAELSVMGQQRAKEIIESSDNFESLKHSMQIMKQEMKISGDKLKAQRLEVQGRMKNYGNPESAGGQATHKYVPGKGIVEIQ